MTKRNKFVVGFLAVILLATIGVVAAFWASTVWVNVDVEDEVTISIADAPVIFTTLTLDDLLKEDVGLIPITATPDSNELFEDGEVNYVLVPITITWTFSNTKPDNTTPQAHLANIDGLPGNFDIDYTIAMLDSSGSALSGDYENYINVVFYDEDVDVEAVITADGWAWTDADTLINALGDPINLGNQITLNFGADNSSTLYMLVFISPVSSLTVANAIENGSIVFRISLELSADQGENTGHILNIVNFPDAP